MANPIATVSGAAVAQGLDLGEPVKYGERGVDCPVCGAAILIHGGCREDVAACNRCKVRMHPECYWGRVATLAEWQEYRRQCHAGPEDYVPAVVCAQCRAKGAPGHANH